MTTINQIKDKEWADQSDENVIMTVVNQIKDKESKGQSDENTNMTTMNQIKDTESKVTKYQYDEHESNQECVTKISIWQA